MCLLTFLPLAWAASLWCVSYRQFAPDFSIALDRGEFLATTAGTYHSPGICRLRPLNIPFPLSNVNWWPYDGLVWQSRGTHGSSLRLPLWIPAVIFGAIVIASAGQWCRARARSPSSPQFKDNRTRGSRGGPGYHPPMNLPAIQSFMQDRRIDAWLVYDFRGSNPVLSRLITMGSHLTRRALLLIPAHGEPRLAVSPLDINQYTRAEVPREQYLGWQGLHSWLSTNLAGYQRVAMEYSPGGNLPICSFVDCGTVEMVRALGIEVVSSADLVQVSAACWNGQAVVERHLEANRKVAGVKDAAFSHIAHQHRAGKHPMEHEVAQFIRDQFKAQNLQFPDGPIVGVNAHAGDPHFEPSAALPTPIKPGDWILIDLWARIAGDENIHSDITWVGYAGSTVPEKHQRVFNAVKAGRDAAVAAAKAAFAGGRSIQGWQLDEAARQPMIDAGFGTFIRHRTGHSLSPGPKVHGLGANLDNMETRDTRQIMPDTGFTIEPGLYLPDFGVRLEINVYVCPKTGPQITSCVQDEPVLVV